MTKIEWTRGADGSEGLTWNPIRARNLKTGGVGHFCVKVSDECLHCYAERLQPRYRNAIRYAAQDIRLVEVFLDRKVLERPLRWTKGRNIFPCSMTDLFGEFVKDEWIDQVVAVAALTEQHTYQVLTKRADRMHEYWTTPGRPERIAQAIEAIIDRNRATLFRNKDRARRALGVLEGIRGGWRLPLHNWWQGVSVGRQKFVDERLGLLLRTPARVRWASFEPVLDELDVRAYLGAGGLDWGVGGGESGPYARPSVIGYLRSLARQFTAAGKPWFLKQLGKHPVNREGEPHHIVDSKGGNMNEWPEDLRVRQFPVRVVAA